MTKTAIIDLKAIAIVLIGFLLDLSKDSFSDRLAAESTAIPHLGQNFAPPTNSFPHFLQKVKTSS